MFLVLILLKLCINFALNLRSAIHKLMGFTGKSAEGDIHLQSMEHSMLEQVYGPWEAGTSWEDHAEAGLGSLRPHEEGSPHQSMCAGRTCDLLWYPRWSKVFQRDWGPWKEPTQVQLTKDCLLWVGCYAGAGEEFGEEGVTQTT